MVGDNQSIGDQFTKAAQGDMQQSTSGTYIQHSEGLLSNFIFLCKIHCYLLGNGDKN